MRLLLTATVIFCTLPVLIAQPLPTPSQAMPSQAMLSQVARLKEKGIPLTDYHIHIRGGMTVERALDWANKTGIRSGVLENQGREWPLSNNAAIRAFIEDAQRLPELLIGIQVNDRDWYKTIDPELLAALDFVLSDTMVMDGQKLWAENEYSTENEDAWLERYFAYNMEVVNEPITILANPMYLPNKMMHRFDDFWTEERMITLIDAAVKNRVAIEIQSDTQFPTKRFVELAIERGAKITIGRNNSDGRANEMKRSLDWLEELNIKPENMLHLKTAAERNTFFWFLDADTEPTAENRIKAIQNVGREMVPNESGVENSILETGVQLLAQRRLAPPYETRAPEDFDVLYVFSNTKEDAKPIDGWFQLQEFTSGRPIAQYIIPPRDGQGLGTGRVLMSRFDRAFIMDPATGRIGEAAVRHERVDEGFRWISYFRLQVQPGETLIVRIVRERAPSESGRQSRGIGFQEFEMLPHWRYVGE